MPVTNSRRKQSWRDGGLAATRYQRTFPDARKSTREEDIHMHVDFWHDDLGVDVKGNNLPDEIWVEFKNVKGDLGWLFGQATTIAFDMPEVQGFVIVNTEELRTYCKENVDWSGTVAKKDSYKRCYSRQDREDLITMLVIEDLQTLPSYEVANYSMDYYHPVTDEVKTIVY